MLDSLGKLPRPQPDVSQIDATAIEGRIDLQYAFETAARFFRAPATL
jgi:hypothetical protein